MKIVSVFGRLALARNGEIDEPEEESIEGFFRRWFEELKRLVPVKK